MGGFYVTRPTASRIRRRRRGRGRAAGHERCFTSSTRVPSGPQV